MINKNQIIIFLVALLVVATVIIVGFRTSGTQTGEQSPVEPTPTVDAPWPSHEVSQVTADQTIPYAAVTAVYPKAQSDAITMTFKSFVDEQIKQFADDTAWATDLKNAESEHLALDISYTSTLASTAQTYIFKMNSYTGGAHGMQVRTTFTFNKDGQLLTLGNLFKNGLNDLPKFASLVQKELLKRDGAQADWIKDGAGGKEDNYKSFTVTDAGITVLFDPYQVAPYSDGAIDISIPKEAFAAYANPVLFWVTTR